MDKALQAMLSKEMVQADKTQCRTDRQSNKRGKTSEEARAVGKQHHPAAAREEKPGMNRARRNQEGLQKSTWD